MKKIKNLIFDLDNTLYDFSSAWEKANKDVFKYLRYDKFTTYEDFFEVYKKINNELVTQINSGKLRIIALRNERLIQTLKIYGIELTENDCELYYEKQFEFIIEHIKPDLILNDKLKKLSKKYKLILLTNGKSKEQRKKLEKLKLENLFRLYISEETKLSKPKQLAFINVLNKEQIILEETMMIGDSVFHDIEAAQKLGMKTCLVEKRWHFDDEVTKYTGYKVKDIHDFINDLEIL